MKSIAFISQFFIKIKLKLNPTSSRVEVPFVRKNGAKLRAAIPCEQSENEKSSTKGKIKASCVVCALTVQCHFNGIGNTIHSPNPIQFKPIHNYIYTHTNRQTNKHTEKCSQKAQ
jgi:hypothetical protein